MYCFQPILYNPSNCRPVFTLRAAVMEPSAKMTALLDLLSFDPLIASQDGQDISMVERIFATLKSMELGAWQLTNGVHLALCSLVTSKHIDIKEASTIHLLFLDKT